MTALVIPDYITHYYYPDKQPFLHLSELDETKRDNVIAELNARESRGETLRAFPDWYMPQRIEAEKRLLKLFTDKGGRPERTSPHYFTLGPSPMLESIYKNNFRKIEFKVDHFSREEICFCIGDSLWTMAESRKPGVKWTNRWFEGQVFNYHELCDVIRQIGLSVGDEASLRANKITYVETMVWTDRHIEKSAKL